MSHSVLKYALKLRDPNRLNWIVEFLIEREGPKVVSEMMAQALRELALEKPGAFIWALQALISRESLLTINEAAASRCANHLILNGFEAGKDFEVHPEGGLMMINPEAFDVLLLSLPVTIQQAIRFNGISGA